MSAGDICCHTVPPVAYDNHHGTTEVSIEENVKFQALSPTLLVAPRTHRSSAFFRCVLPSQTPNALLRTAETFPPALSSRSAKPTAIRVEHHECPSYHQ